MPCLPFSRRGQASNFALFLVCALWIQKESAHRLLAKRAVHQSCMDFPPPSLLLLGEARDAGYASRVKTSHTPPRQQWRGVVWLIVRGESSYHRCDSWELAGPLNHSRRKDLKGSTFSAQGSGGIPCCCPCLWHPVEWRPQVSALSRKHPICRGFKTDFITCRTVFAADVRNSNQRGVVRDMGTIANPTELFVSTRRMHQQGCYLTTHAGVAE